MVPTTHLQLIYYITLLHLSNSLTDHSSITLLPYLTSTALPLKQQLYSSVAHIQYSHSSTNLPQWHYLYVADAEELAANQDVELSREYHASVQDVIGRFNCYWFFFKDNFYETWCTSEHVNSSALLISFVAYELKLYVSLSRATYQHKP